MSGFVYHNHWVRIVCHMLIIRKKQFEAIKISAYMTYLLRTVRKTWPEQCLELGDEDLVRRIEKCLERAESHGITKTNNKTRFINLAFLLERDDFDTAAETQWAATILGWESGSENLKMSALEKRAEIEMERQIEAQRNST
jgi:hypothetical protein